ncbi:MAG TPA: folate-binding protein [Gammaproteobacteria bacterium]|jgi:folate-binding protein YgfZ|nr:folate-binding protein [Gammaproteobacteria bacterium]
MTPRYCPSPSYGCIEVRGADAASFLHAQLSRALDTLDGALAPLAGWHDPRGRVRALVRVFKRADRWWLVTQSDVVAATAKRLAMFVLRAAVKIEPAGGVRVAALVAEDAWLDAHGLPSSTRANGVVARGELACVRLGARLWHVVGPRAAVDGFVPGLPRASEDVALLGEIRLGLPAVGAPLVELFVAQMLNLDLLDAVSFDKGCYPGQEVIARVRHLGDVKRRLRRYASDVAAPPAPRSAVVASADGTSVGEVVRSARAEAGVELLAVVEHMAAAGALAIGAAPLRELPLPYAVPTT